MIRAILLLGSNEGDRRNFLHLAQQAIVSYIGPIERASGFYETEPWGKKDQPFFLNQVIIVSTNLTARKVLEAIHTIEFEFGRTRTLKWGPRTLDIDILFYGSDTIRESDLIIPHPAIAQRRFTLVPLVELIPDFIHPISGKKMSTLLEECEDEGMVKKV